MMLMDRWTINILSMMTMGTSSDASIERKKMDNSVSTASQFKLISSNLMTLVTLMSLMTFKILMTLKILKILMMSKLKQLFDKQ